MIAVLLRGSQWYVFLASRTNPLNVLPASSLRNSLCSSPFCASCTSSMLLSPKPPVPRSKPESLPPKPSPTQAPFPRVTPASLGSAAATAWKPGASHRSPDAAERPRGLVQLWIFVGSRHLVGPEVSVWKGGCLCTYQLRPTTCRILQKISRRDQDNLQELHLWGSC